MSGRANLTEADLHQVNLKGANLSRANLRGAELKGAILISADLWGANLVKANLSKTKLEGTKLGWVDLSGADLTGAELPGADLTNVDLRGANLSGADLRGADLKGADLTNVDLRRADLRGADLRGIVPRGADLTEATLGRADLREADLRGTKALAQNQVEQGIGDRTTKLPSHLQPSGAWSKSTTVTFLFTDIEGFTSMSEKHPQMQAALTHYDQILRSTVEASGGYVFKTVDDTCCVAFTTARQALEAALAAQRAFFAEQWGESATVRVRMALHTGLAEERDGDYFGSPVNQVVHLLSAGHGGQILLSAVTYESVRDDLDHPEELGEELRDLGEHHLRDLEYTEHIYQLVVPDLPSDFPPPKTHGPIVPPEPESLNLLDRRYSCAGLIGSGRLAKVYLAHDRELDRDVALKVLWPQYSNDEEFVERFKREAKSAAKLSHPNIVPVHDAGEGEFEGRKVSYIAMEYVPGGTLKELILKEGPLPAPTAVELTLQIARALQAAHGHGIVYRDMKPQNVLLTESGEAKVADFGIARAASSSQMSRVGLVLSTLHYISPEQAMAKPASFRSDLYSLGVVLYEMLTGELPFDAEDEVGIVTQHVNGQLRPPKEANSDVPERINAVTVRLLAKDPNERYPDATEFIADLERVSRFLEDGETVVEQPLSRDGVREAEPVVTATEEDSERFITRSVFPPEISLGTSVIPDLTGQHVSQARSMLSNAGLTLGDQKEAPSETTPEGEIIGQSPKASTVVKRGSLVSITASSGLRKVSMTERRDHSSGRDRIPAGTVTFLFTDIEGSTALWENHPLQMQAALARHDQILRQAVEAHRGYVFKTVGDAFCATFANARDALEATLAAQRALFAERWGQNVKVRVRMALHTGAAEERGGDYFGPPVNRVARIESAGHGGQVLLSEATCNLVRDVLVHLEPEAELRDLGEHHLRDLEYTEHIYQLVVPDLPSDFPPPKTHGPIVPPEPVSVTGLIRSLDVPDSPSDFPPPKTHGPIVPPEPESLNLLDRRYSRIRSIGSGGLAEVYLVHDEVLDRKVAFKVLWPQYSNDEEFVERFKREAKSAAKLSHPNIVPVHDAGEGEFEGRKVSYIAMEYVPGGTLKELILKEGPLPAPTAVELTLQIARALQAAHGHGIVYRDMKPQNVLLTESGEAKVADFGIARAASSSQTTPTGSILGTPHYISPEQAIGNPASPRSDFYALGVVLYEMLTGQLPFDAETPIGILSKHVNGQLRPPKEANPDVPERINAVTVRLLAKDPNERYPDAAALIADLEQVRDEPERA